MAEKYGRKVKELMTKEAKKIFADNNGFVFSNIEKIKASDIDLFRKKMRHAGTRFVILKNRLAKFALDETGLEEFNETISENKTIGVGIIREDPVQIARLMMEFSRENAGFKVKDGYLEGQHLTQQAIKELSELPGRQQLIAMVLRTMNAPLTNFAGCLSAMVRKILYVLNAVKEKKETGS